MKKLRSHTFVLLVLFILACNLPFGSTATVEPPGVPEVSEPPQVDLPAEIAPAISGPVVPEHRIGIRIVENGIAEFYDRDTGKKFVPRGMNYVRLANQTKMDGSSTFGHALFDPGKYNSLKVSSDLSKMHTDGYNVVRVFLSPDTMGTTTGGFSADYMKNIVEFLKYAEASEMYVIFTLDWIPGGKYGKILSADCCTTFTTMNANYLPPAGLEANKVFFQDFAKELIQSGAPTEYIFSYALRNEMFYDMDQPPLSFTSGKVKTANGKTYDMSSLAEKKKMIEENNIYWLDTIRAAILEVDPTALVSVGFFVPQEPNPARIGDMRYVVSAPAIWQSQLDFVDLHAYPGFELNLKQHVENFGMTNAQQKPIIMGEFGGAVSQFASIQNAAFAFRDWQVESCKYGFDGWIFWTWDLDEQPDFFNALMQEGTINGVLAPALRPDPCAP